MQQYLIAVSIGIGYSVFIPLWVYDKLIGRSSRIRWRHYRWDTVAACYGIDISKYRDDKIGFLVDLAIKIKEEK